MYLLILYNTTAGSGEDVFRVIRDLCLDILPGQITAVVGASGSGKSLLAHSILGDPALQQQDGGQDPV